MEQIKGFTKKTSCFAMGKVPWLKKIGSETEREKHDRDALRKQNKVFEKKKDTAV